MVDQAEILRLRVFEFEVAWGDKSLNIQENVAEAVPAEHSKYGDAQHDFNCNNRPKCRHIHIYTFECAHQSASPALGRT